MSNKILMIEDELGLILTVGDRLRSEGYDFHSCTNGIEGEKLAEMEDWDLIILDIMLPGRDGFTICNNLRAAQFNTPILMLTARSQIDDKVNGFKMGSDDYLCKPFEMVELLARIKALIKRSEISTHAQGEQKSDTLNKIIDLKRGVICMDNTEYPLSAQEIKLLEYFYLHPQTIISREELLNSVWGYDTDISTRTIDVHVARLRQKLGDVKDVPKYIHTIRGIGYKFTPPDS